MLKSDYYQAFEDYRKARRSAAIQEVLARIRGNPEDLTLLSYEEVRQQLQAIEKNIEQLAEIPLDKIVGSVGRYHDFTRRYLPKSSIDQGRWARVMAITKGLSGLPPIDVYRIGEVYFVKDGNHRVSVARQMGNTSIQAYITDVESKVNITSDIKPDDLIIKSEQVKFLNKTLLDQSRPGADITATKAGAYPTLLEHIKVHRYYMGAEQEREIPFDVAATHWFDEVFLPVINIIKKRELLRDFPDRTNTDLYLWLADHRAGLEQDVGWDIGTEAALSDLSEKFSSRKHNPIREIAKNLIKLILPDVIEGGPPPGTWRKRLFNLTVREHLFTDLIVALDDSENMWNAVDQAIILANLEKSRIHGVHIHSKITYTSQEEHLQIKTDFHQRCRKARIDKSDFIISDGEIGKVLCDHSRFADLIVLPLNHPPGEQVISRLGSGITFLIRSCPIPILTVPCLPSQMDKILLAYDGSIKAKEAMYIAAYLGSQHQTSLNILVSSDGLNNPENILKEAREYLSSFPIDTNYRVTESGIAEEIKQLQQNGEINLVLIGGYGNTPIVDVVVGSVVDRVLREIQLPILICR